MDQLCELLLMMKESEDPNDIPKLVNAVLVLDTFIDLHSGEKLKLESIKQIRWDIYRSLS